MNWLVVFTVFSSAILPSVFADIDLTHFLAEGTDQRFPSKGYSRTVTANGTIEALGGIYLYNAEFFAPEHSGTHTDSPAHFQLGQHNIGEIPFDRLSGPGVVIDISQKAADNPDVAVEVRDIKNWERRYGNIPKGAVVIMNSGYHKHYYDNKKYYGRPEGVPDTDIENMHYPGFSGAAMEYLITKRDIVGFAVDTISLDRAQDNNRFEAHRIAAAANVWGVENIGHLDKLPPKGFLLYNMPLKLTDGSGAPSRVFAIMPGETSSIRKTTRSVQHTGVCVCALHQHSNRFLNVEILNKISFYR